MNKTIVFDMDGTIADLYGVENWLEKLRAENSSPYEDAPPLYDFVKLNALLNQLKQQNYTIAVVSWTAKGGTKEYNKRVRKAKINWLEKHGFPADKIHIVKYGTTKANCTRKMGGFQILVDDNEQVRAGWHLGATIDPVKQNIITELEKLLVA